MDYKEARALQARKHIELMNDMFAKEIQDSISSTITYSDDFAPEFAYSDIETQITVVDKDTVSAVIYETTNSSSKTAVLNFASYKNPGGRFIDGSMAQEEALCHESFLYNVLEKFTNTYYSWNNQHKNNALYENRALYTPNVAFIRNKRYVYCNVITCAAPNWSAAGKYGRVTKQQNSDALRNRIWFILDIARMQDIDTLILGAYGCGVFAQDPIEVSSIFKELLEEQHYGFSKVIFAIPGKYTDNHKAFAKTFV